MKWLRWLLAGPSPIHEPDHPAVMASDPLWLEADRIVRAEERRLALFRWLR